jgi:multisubunit Na+/H+ antiporter MnhE subunit
MDIGPPTLHPGGDSVRPFGAFLLWTVYLMFAESRGVFSASLGLGFSLLASWAAVPSAPAHWRRLPGAAKAWVRLAGGLVAETARAGFRVGLLALSPRPNLAPAVIRVPVDPAWTVVDRAFAAHSITLTPGELAIDDENGGLTLHVLQNEGEDALRRALADRMALWARATAVWENP